MPEEKQTPTKLTCINTITGEETFTKGYDNWRDDQLSGPIKPHPLDHINFNVPYFHRDFWGNKYDVEGTRLPGYPSVNLVIQKFIKDWKKEHPDDLPAK